MFLCDKCQDKYDYKKYLINIRGRKIDAYFESADPSYSFPNYQICTGCWIIFKTERIKHKIEIIGKREFVCHACETKTNEIDSNDVDLCLECADAFEIFMNGK